MIQLGLADDASDGVSSTGTVALPGAVASTTGATMNTVVAGPHQDDINSFLTANAAPDVTATANFLMAYQTADQAGVAQELVNNGVDAMVVSAAMNQVADRAQFMGVDKSWIWGALTLASAGASAFHGTRRNNGSIFWGGVWFLGGLLFPAITPAIALGQGFTKVKP